MSITETRHFFYYLKDKEYKERAWEMFLATDDKYKMNFDEYLAENRKRAVRKVNVEQNEHSDIEAIVFGTQFIKPKKKGGE